MSGSARPGVGIMGELRYPWLVKKLPGLQILSRVTGAFMLMRRRVFEEVGGFEEDFFLFFEDADRSLRVRRHGDRLVGPRGRIDHVDGQSVAGARSAAG